MIRSIEINGYRGFKSFRMTDLGRINLLVGRNNSGKTSILEGLQLLAAGSNPAALWRMLSRRGEQVLSDNTGGRQGQADFDISHLFYGHELYADAVLSISTANDIPGHSVRYIIEQPKAEEQTQLFAQFQQFASLGPQFALRVSGEPAFNWPPIPVSKDGTFRPEVLAQLSNIARQTTQDATQYVLTESLSIGELFQLWNSIVLTPDEDRVVSALKILDKNIERIAVIGIGNVFLGGPFFSPFPSPRGGFAVKVSGSERRIPIGTFGDGTWRMLSLAVAVSRAKNNILLVDEIDTGLHYTVMADMWRLINEASKLFNVQVFATTHSYDCVHSLSDICNSFGNEDNAITIQRIEPTRHKAIAFTEEQIRMAAERDVEVR